MQFNKDRIKSELSKKPKSCFLNELTTNDNGRLTLKINDNISFETYLLNENREKKLYVFLSAVGIYKNSDTVFHRVMWASKFNGLCLYIDDPLRVKKKFAPMFYWGTLNEDYTSYLIDIVNRIIKLYSVRDEDVNFISSSNGGFASIRVANSFPESKCYVFCPQISIPLYFEGRQNASLYFDNAFEKKEALNRLEVKWILNSPNAHFFIFSNIFCESDKKQMQYLLESADKNVETGVVKLNNKCIIFLENIKAKNPHLVQPDLYFSVFFNNLDLWKMNMETLKNINTLLEDELQHNTNLAEKLLNYQNN